MRKLLILLMCVCLSSCAYLTKTKCQRKLDYVFKNCPDLIDTAKTVVRYDTIIKFATIKGDIVQKIDSSAVDSLVNILRSLEPCISDKNSEVIKQEIIKTIPKGYNPFDITIDTLGVVINIKQKNGKVDYEVLRNDIAIHQAKTIKTNNVTKIDKELPVPWWKDFWFYVALFLAMVLLLVLWKK